MDDRVAHETWRAIIDWLRRSDIDDCRRHADELQARLDLAPADQPLVRMSLNDDVFYRSVNWARMSLGMPRMQRRG